jgi:pimeloyl-ACP methyl ester carboxylesterase
MNLFKPRAFTKRWRTFMVGGLLAAAALAAGAGPAIVLAHGKRDAPTYALDPLVQALRARGFTVETPDMPWSAARQYDADHSAALSMLVDAVRRLRAQGANPVFIGGHGLGGNSALAAAARVSVDGVVMVAPAHTPDAEPFALVVGPSLGLAREVVARGQGAQVLALLDHDHRATQEIRISAASYLSYFAPDGTAAMSVSAPQLAAGVPVLWVYGSWDVMRDEGRALFFSRLPPHPRHRQRALFTPLGNTPSAAVVEVADWLERAALGGR